MLFFLKINRLILLLSISVLVSCSERIKPPEAVSGTLDLSNYDLRKKGPVDLSGQWMFYRGVFIPPQTISEALIAQDEKKIPGSHGDIEVPGTFNRFKSPSGETGPLGFGSYLLKIEGVDHHPDANLAFYLKDALTAYSIYLIPDSSDAEHHKYATIPLMTNGKTAETVDTSIPQHLPLLTPFRLQTSGFYVLVHVSNFHDNLGGMVYPIEFGYEKDMLKINDDRRSIDFLIMGILLMMAVYHLVLFLVRNEDTSSLFFAVFNALVMIRVLLTKKYLQQWFPEPDTIVFELMMKADYATFYFAVPIFYSFIRRVFWPQHYQIIEKSLWFIAVLFSVGFLWPQRIYADFLIYYEVLTLVAFLLIIWQSVKAIRAHKTGAIISLAGFLVLTASGINDILHASEVISTEYILSYGLIAFIFSQSYILARRFASAFHTAEHLSQNLKLEVEKQTVELQQKNEALKQVDEQKTTFFQNISHEIRTPLTLIDGPLQNILEDNDHNLPAATRQQLILMKRNTGQLLRLVNQLLDLSKLEAGKMSLNKKVYNFSEQINNVSEIFRIMAENNQIRFQVKLPQSPVYIEADYEKIEKVIFNLLSNAVKFTPADESIMVELRDQRSPGSQEDIILSVKDTGSGIDDKNLPFIFDRFHQAEQGITRSQEGTGIGLSIVKEFINLHNGKVTVESKKGEGTEFCIHLKQFIAGQPSTSTGDSSETAKKPELNENKTADEPDTSATPYPDGIDLASIDPGKKTILLLDDNIDLRLFVYHLLHEKYNMIHAPNGARALELLEEFSPDLIMTDYMMPLMDGFEFLEKAKSKSKIKDIPVMMLTAGDSSQIEKQNVHVDVFLSKPFKVNELNNLLTKLLK